MPTTPELIAQSLADLLPLSSSSTSSPRSSSSSSSSSAAAAAPAAVAVAAASNGDELARVRRRRRERRRRANEQVGHALRNQSLRNQSRSLARLSINYPNQLLVWLHFFLYEQQPYVNHYSPLLYIKHSLYNNALLASNSERRTAACPLICYKVSQHLNQRLR
jgi:hypothetical protein